MSSGIPAPLSSMDIITYLPSFLALIYISEPSCVYFIALSTILIITCIISLASIFTRSSSLPQSTCILCSQLFLLICFNASAITSSISWSDILRVTIPSSNLVTDNIFSTRLINHSESSYISVNICSLVSLSSLS